MEDERKDSLYFMLTVHVRFLMNKIAPVKTMSFKKVHAYT